MQDARVCRKIERKKPRDNEKQQSQPPTATTNKEREKKRSTSIRGQSYFSRTIRCDVAPLKKIPVTLANKERYCS